MREDRKREAGVRWGPEAGEREREPGPARAAQAWTTREGAERTALGGEAVRETAVDCDVEVQAVGWQLEGPA